MQLLLLSIFWFNGCNDIFRQKNYSTRAELYCIKELDILGEVFNNMLQRTQAHMLRQTEAGSEQVKLNLSLE